MYYIGLMSGTSLDGVDAALVDFSGTTPALLTTHLEPIPKALRAKLLSLTLPGDSEIDRMGQVDNAFADCQVNAVNHLLEKAGIPPSQIIAIGSHGQTIRHRPDFASPFTLQIGNPARMTEALNITVIADFRRRDMAAEGQGAPLVPAFHEWLFQTSAEHRFVVNIGGIANVTVLDKDSSIQAIGYDTGPGNVLMDYWIDKCRQLPCDVNGQWAAEGRVNQTLLEHLLSTDYLQLPHPKSTGRELFNGPWLEQKLIKSGISCSAEDIQATLLEFTAISISQAIERHNISEKSIFICGGGAENLGLFTRLSEYLAPNPVHKTDHLGVPASWLEACAFAWLAKQCLEKQTGNLPAVTGAKGRRILGAIYQP